MKRLLIYILVLAAAVISCNRIEMDEQPGVVIGGKTYTLEAGIISTRTTYTPPYAVIWDDDDVLSVIASKDGVYSGYSFAKSDGNNFVSEDLVVFDNMSVIYPYDAAFVALDAEGYTTSPVTVSSGTQAGPGTGTHIDAPLYGYTTTASVEMHHTTTLFAVTVNNTSAKDIVVSELKLSNDQNHPMTGEFYISPVSGELRAAENAVPEASIQITDGIVKAGESGVFYLSSAPFTLNEGQKIIVDATIDGEVHSFEKYMSGPSPFIAGGVNNTTVIVSGAAPGQHELIFQFTNKGITNPDYSFNADGGAYQTDYFIVNVDGTDVTDYDATYYNDFVFETVDASGTPVDWTYAVRTGGHNSFTIGCDGNTGEESRTAYINVYFKNTAEYVVVGTYKSVPAVLETISDADPILTFTVTQAAKEPEPDVPEGDILQYIFEGKGISLHWSTELSSADAGQIGSGWYGCTLNGANLSDTRNDPCYSALTFKAFDYEGNEVTWLSAACGRIDSPGEMNGFAISYEANTSSAPRTATLKAYYSGDDDYVIQTVRHISATETDTITLEDPSVEPVYELMVTQPGAVVAE